MIKKIRLIYNPIAGKGKSELASKELESFLTAEGYSVVSSGAEELVQNEPLTPSLSQFDALLLAGGDGTLMRLLPFLIQSQTPVYMLPTGNESLFAREFNMKQCSKTVLQTLKQNIVSKHYVPNANGIHFFTMLSIGLDADIVATISEKRTGPLGHHGYVIPTLKSALRHKAPRLTLRDSSKTLIDKQSGFLILTNNSQYALKIPFVPEADSSEKNICVRFFPYNNALGFVSLSLRTLLFGAQSSSSSYFEADSFYVEASPEEAAAQADGDFISNTPLEIKIGSESINILLTSKN